MLTRWVVDAIVIGMVKSPGQGHVNTTPVRMGFIIVPAIIAFNFILFLIIDSSKGC
jgi:hypothetical protein